MKKWYKDELKQNIGIPASIQFLAWLNDDCNKTQRDLCTIKVARFLVGVYIDDGPHPYRYLDAGINPTVELPVSLLWARLAKISPPLTFVSRPNKKDYPPDSKILSSRQ
jgi:hypothetical protein